jgi:hypothetical protein
VYKSETKQASGGPAFAISMGPRNQQCVCGIMNEASGVLSSPPGPLAKVRVIQTLIKSKLRVACCFEVRLPRNPVVRKSNPNKIKKEKKKKKS